MKPVDSTVQVVLADDHELVRAGIRSLLTAMADVQVMAEVRDGAELLELLESVHPDLVICDINMPGMDGITAMRRIRQLYPQLRVIMLTMNDSAESIRAAMTAGANGYVRKDAPDIELEMALRGVMATGRYIGSGVAQRLLEPVEPGPEELLTERQIEILRLLAGGKSSKEIAYDLGLSSKTVDVHRTRIMERLGLKDVASLTLYAVRKGLIKP
ncbi:MAG TPA: response regulator transcription factor [Ramlibacter sp.]|uniref:response regulator transcription factor n=1 Tax=Ramlibacter sp. TaxID=1917967 RepID=UPI002D7F8994|nr:response regulator transcription factor [Ramlibacter sp.]HET8745126.1 response regulator transcription factor [Ramlibacter sp.]